MFGGQVGFGVWLFKGKNKATHILKNSFYFYMLNNVFQENHFFHKILS